MRSIRSLAGCLAAASLAVACGSASEAPPPPWSATHPDPAGMHFSDASGLCAITVQYPNEAPGEIDWNGEQYIQRSRSIGGRGGGSPVARSGDWTIYHPSSGKLVVDTGSASFEYRSGSKCGSNAAPPT